MARSVGRRPHQITTFEASLSFHDSMVVIERDKRPPPRNRTVGSRQGLGVGR